jgi:signal transduction histidine kinase
LASPEILYRQASSADESGERPRSGDTLQRLKHLTVLKTEEDSMPDHGACDLFSHPIALIDQEGRILNVNSSWREIFPQQPNDYLYKDWNISVHADPVLYWQQVLKSAMSSETKSIRVEASQKHCDFFFSEGRGAVESMFWVRFEIIDKAARDRAVLAHDERLSAMGEMAAGIAHEILNPLTIIAGKAMSLRGMLPDEEHPKFQDMRKCMDSITNQCNRITKIVRALRTFSRDGTKDALQPVPLRQMIDESIALCSEKSRLRGTNYRVEELPENAVVYCRAVQVVQILINLISNAIDATQDVALPEVHIRYQLIPDGIVVLVSDNGPGVPEALEQKIFQPFYTTKDVGKGTGLGLSLSLRLSHDNGGDLFLDRTVGPSCFALKLATKKPMQAAG